MLNKKISEFLRDREFISAATCDFDGRPNAAPKFLLKVDGKSIYLVDYSLTKTWENLKINPRASLSFVDTDTLQGYQINGPVEMIEKGPAFDKMVNELREKEITLSADRIIKGLHRDKSHEIFEVAIPEKLAILKVTIEEITEISPKGELKKERYT